MTNRTLDTIAANLALIEVRLAEAHSLIREAQAAIATRDQNLAIGTLLPVQQDLADADALLRAVLIVHREPGKGRP